MKNFAIQIRAKDSWLQFEIMQLSRWVAAKHYFIIWSCLKEQPENGRFASG